MLHSILFRWLFPVLLLAFVLTTDPAFSAEMARPDIGPQLKQGQGSGPRSALLEYLRRSEKSADTETLLKDDAYRTALAAHEVLRVTGDTALAALMDRHSDFPAFLKAFLRDREWMESYLAAGKPPTATEYGLEILYQIWKADGSATDFGKYKQLSAAIGVAWGSDGRGAELLRAGAKKKPFGIDPVWRFKFYKNRHKAGRLHPMFSRLKSWELRYVVDKAWDDASIEWCNENINVPLQRYTDACWAVRYRGKSDFGNTIQGPIFYKPWENLMCQAENAKVHGGVCGSISSFGAIATAAHGIPSYTTGQPGHCAYAVRFARGDWRGGFGGPDGSPHTAIWPGNIHFVNLMERVFGDDVGLNRALAHQARAHILLDCGDVVGAQKAISAALAISPMHLDLRREQIAMLEKSGTMTAADWCQLADALLDTFGVHSDPAIALVREIEPKFLDGADDDVMLAWYAKVHAAAARAAASWAWADEFGGNLLPKQAAKLKSDKAREGLLRIALAAHLRSADGACFGKTLEWGINNFVAKGSADAFGRAFADAVKGVTVKFDDKQLRQSYEKAILAACEARSISAFQSLSRSALRFVRKDIGSVKLNLPPGKLISCDGMLRPSSQAWCSAVDFYNVLNETGGVVHTKAERNPSVIVELPRRVNISGVVAVKTDGSESRMKKMRVSRSVDGATWFPIEETPAMPKQWRIDPPADTQARWIKIEALNDKPEFMHFRNILVFAKE